MNKLINEIDIMEEVILSTKQHLIPSSPESINKIVWSPKLITDDSVFQKRESKITFNQEKKVRYEDLIEILTFNEAFGQQFSRELGAKVEQMILPERVEGISESNCFFSFDAKGKTLRKEFTLPKEKNKKELVIQEEFAQAGVIIIFVASIADTLNESGTLGYKKLIQQVGSMGHYTWLQGIAYGYEGSVFAGFLQKSLRRFTYIDGYHRAQLFAIALG